MTTTALFVELLVGGIQSLAWLAVLALLWCTPGRLVGFLRPISPGESLILLAAAYSLGVVLDRVWDAAFKPFDRRTKRAILKQPERAHKIRALLFTEDQVRANFVEYIRSRMRIARATVCNSILLAIAAAVVTMMRPESSGSPRLVVLGSFFAGLAVLAAYAYRNITRTYYQTLVRLEPYLPKK